MFAGAFFVVLVFGCCCGVEVLVGCYGCGVVL